MELLPVELRRVILRYMDLPSLKAVRLSSKSWAALGEEYLMPHDFMTLPHRDDIHRLLAISQHPMFSFRIQSLFINLGEINEYHARHNTYFIQYMRDSDERSEALEMAWKGYAHIRNLKELYIGTYNQLHLLKEVFKGLPNLQTISISLMTSPFQSPTSPEMFHKLWKDPEMFNEIWKIPSTRLLSRGPTTERFTTLLTAITSSPTICIRNLSHDRLPFEFFAQKSILISLLSTAFHTLTSLDLTIDYTEMPNDLHHLQGFQNLSQCLRCAADLRTLRLGFQSRKKTSISPLLCKFEEQQFSFKKLEFLTFEGVTTKELELGNFLVKQKMLKRLRLGGPGLKSPHQPANGGVHLREGNFANLFERVEGDMTLDRFDVMGDLKGWESGEMWILDIAEEVSNLKDYVLD